MNNISELAEKAAKGDGAAFDSLYEQTKSGVWFTCISLLKNEENAKDVMQDTYIAAFEKLGSLADLGGIQSWLNKIAANKCKNYIRTISNSHMAENGEELLENIPDDKLIPEEYVTDMAKRRIIMDIIERSLSEEQYRTIILYYFDEMTAAEIAELMDCHEKTVLYRLKTARSKIKEEVMRYEEENKDRLHAVVFVPTLTRLFRIEAENTSVPNVPIELWVSPNTQNIFPSNAAVSAVKQGGKTMLNTLNAKIIAGACAAVVVGGGVTAGVIISSNSKNNTTSTPVVSAPANISTSANVSKPAEQSDPAVSNANFAAWGTTSAATSNDRMVEGDFEFQVYIKESSGESDPNYVMITSYFGSDGDVTIPSTLGGKPVKSIHRMIWGDIVSVTIPDTVTEIDIFAFGNYQGLKQIVFSKNLEEIGYGAFMGCISLESVVLPDGLKIISDEAFRYCRSLKSVTVPDSVEKIYCWTFANVAEDCEIHYKGQVYTPMEIAELFKDAPADYA